MPQANLLEGRNALIFAAYGEIGRAVAVTLARHGAIVHLSGRKREQAETVADAIRAAGGSAFADEIDACDETAVETYVAAKAAEVGIDVVFNPIGPRAGDAGYGTPSPVLSYPHWRMAIDTIAGSQFMTARASQKHMRPGGSIVMLSSTLVSSMVPFMAGVTAACGAVEVMTQVLAAECGQSGVRVNCVRPTAMDETRTIKETNAAMRKALGIPADAPPVPSQRALGRAITTQDTAGAVAFLASDMAGGVSGQVLQVCGGQFRT